MSCRQGMPCANGYSKMVSAKGLGVSMTTAAAALAPCVEICQASSTPSDSAEMNCTPSGNGTTSLRNQLNCPFTSQCCDDIHSALVEPKCHLIAQANIGHVFRSLGGRCNESQLRIR